MAALFIMNFKDKVVFFAGFGKRAYVNGKGGGAAGMGSSLFTVDKNAALIINAAKVEKDDFPCPFSRGSECTVIPHTFNEVRVADAGKFAFGSGKTITTEGISLVSEDVDIYG